MKPFISIFSPHLYCLCVFYILKLNRWTKLPITFKMVVIKMLKDMSNAIKNQLKFSITTFFNAIKAAKKDGFYSMKCNQI